MAGKNISYQEHDSVPIGNQAMVIYGRTKYHQNCQRLIYWFIKPHEYSWSQLISSLTNEIMNMHVNIVICQPIGTASKSWYHSPLSSQISCFKALLLRVGLIISCQYEYLEARNRSTKQINIVPTEWGIYV